MDPEETYADEDFDVDQERDDDVKEMDSPETQEIDLDHQESDTDWSSPARQQQQQQRPNSLGQGGRASGSHKLQAQTTTTTTLRAKRDDEARQKYETYVAALPFAAESVAEMHHKLERIVAHIVTAVEAQDFHVGLSTWSHKLECWLSMHAPMKRQMRAQLALLYFNILIRPGCPPKVFSNAATMFVNLASNKKLLDLDDLILPWKPLYDLAERELYPKQRKTGTTPMIGTVAAVSLVAQRFYPPHEAPAMLEAILPKLDGTDLSNVLVSQALLIKWLPASHPQEWLPAAFSLWQSFNSTVWTSNWLDLMSQLAELHLDPTVSGPQRRSHYQRKAEQGATAPAEAAEDLNLDPTWPGLMRDFGLFDEQQWQWMTSECLRTMDVPVGNSDKTSDGFLSFAGSGTQDDEVSKAISPFVGSQQGRTNALARLFVYSLMEDASPSPPSAVPSPIPSTPATPRTAASTAPKTSLGGSKVLDSLAKFVQATETFFHPSNAGLWSYKLINFAYCLSHHFYHRWTLEERSDCRTPRAWRLTKKIKHEFVLQLRTVMLLSMYIKDGYLMTLSHGTLRILALLEPEVVIPSILERAYPDLETTLETQRTISTLANLSTLSTAFLSREIAPFGPKHLAPILDLSIPGIDLNDPGKTRQTCLLIVQALSHVTVLDDLTRPEYLACLDQKSSKRRASSMLIDADGTEEPPPSDAGAAASSAGTVADPAGCGPSGSQAEEDQLTRESTVTIPDWVVKLLKAVFNILENLPEPGKGGKAGGASEEALLATVCGMMDAVCDKLSPRLFDDALRLVYDFAAHTPRSNCARVIGQLLACFTRSDSEKTLALFVPLCCRMIKQELDFGAASAPSSTTSTSPLTEDTTFQWYCYLLNAVFSDAGPAILSHADAILTLLKDMLQRARSERGYTHVGRLLSSLLSDAGSMWTYNGSRMPQKATDSFISESHLTWGEKVEAKNAVVNWHVPSDEELNFVINVLRDITVPAVEKLEALVNGQHGDLQDSTWSKEYARWASHMRNSLLSTPGLAQLPEELGAPGMAISDHGDTDLPFISERVSYRCSVVLQDESDPRHQFVVQLRKRMGSVLHQSAQYLSTDEHVSGVEKVDSVKMMISCIKTYLLDYPLERNEHDTAKKRFEFSKLTSRISEAEKALPLDYWARRARYYNSSRLRLSSFARRRSVYEDQLILDLGDFCLSSYTSIRKASQRALERVASYYDGTRSMLFPKFFDYLKPGVEVDSMKGALWMIGSKAFGNLAVSDWRWTAQYIIALLESQHQEKPSIQKLVRELITDTVIRLPEPHSLRLGKNTAELSEVCLRLVGMTHVGGVHEALRDRLASFAQKRLEVKDLRYQQLIPQLMDKAKDDNTHWRYRSAATRFLRALVRRDTPVVPDVLQYMMKSSVSELPTLRLHGQLASTKMLHFVKLRSLSANDPESMLLQRSKHPLKKTFPLPSPVPADFREKEFQRHVQEPMRAGEPLYDKIQTGWLVWGTSLEGYEPPAKDVSPITWEAASEPALEAAAAILSTPTWWTEHVQHLAQETSRDYPALDNVVFLKTIFQIYEDRFLALVKPLVESHITDGSDRHRVRAGLELLIGVYRGSKHWPLVKSDAFRAWMDSLIPKMVASVRPDTQGAAEMSIDYCLVNRDPRRTQSLISCLMDQHFDPESSEAFAEAKKAALVGCVARNLSWPYELPTNQFWDAIASPYQEIRTTVVDNLRQMSLLRLHPSFVNVASFLQWCERQGETDLLLWIDQPTSQRFDQLVAQLEQLRQVRQPASTGAQAYDSACMSVLDWIYENSFNHRLTLVFPLAQRLLPELFRMMEMLDNAELRNAAKKALAALATLHYPIILVKPMMFSILTLLKTTESWRQKMDLMPVLQVFFFNHLNVIEEKVVVGLLDTLVDLLSDKALEVREAAATTLSGIVRCSQRRAIVFLKERFLEIVRTTKIPRRRKANGEERPGYQGAVVKAHSGVLGAAALIDAHPYNVPSWLPDLLLEVMGMHIASPAPVSTTVRRCLSDFKKSHQDSWVEDSKAFTEEQQMELSDLLIPPSNYYA